jgi:hypothetical protein
MAPIGRFSYHDRKIKFLQHKSGKYRTLLGEFDRGDMGMSFGSV